jgi:hypothetical protein
MTETSGGIEAMMTPYSVNANGTTIHCIMDAVRNNLSVLSSFGYGFAIPESETVQIPGWEIRLVDKRGMGNHGSYVAIATTPANYKFQLAETIRQLRPLADNAALDPANWRGWSVDFGTMLLPIVGSSCHRNPGGTWFAKDDRWNYHHHTCMNYLNVGDNRCRLWVKPR